MPRHKNYVTNKTGVKASVLYLFATLFNKGVMFLTVPVFTRLLSTSDYGVVTTFNSWVDICTSILSMALYISFNTAFNDYGETIHDYLNTIITFTLCVSGTVIVITCIGGSIFKFSLYFAVLALLQSMANAIITEYSQYLMMSFNYVERTIFMALPNFLSVIVSIVIIIDLSKDKYLGKIIPTAIVFVLFAFVCLVRVFSRSKPKLNIAYIKYGLAISLPLVLHGIALNILSQSARTMLTVMVGAHETGIFSLAFNFGMIATVFTMALDGIWVPWFMNKLKQKTYSQINKVASDYILLMSYIMLSVMLCGPELLKLMASKDYWEGISVIPSIVLSNYLIFLYTFHVYVEQYHKKTIIISLNTLTAAVFNIILNLYMIPKFGYIGAGVTMVVSYILSFSLHALETKRLEPNLFSKKMFIRPCILMILSIFIFYSFISNPFIRWIAAFFLVMLGIFVNKKTIITYLGSANKKG